MSCGVSLPTPPTPSSIVPLQGASSRILDTLALHLALEQGLLPAHRRLQEKGALEVRMSAVIRAVGGYTNRASRS
jgi:hypothetical protein